MCIHYCFIKKKINKLYKTYLNGCGENNTFFFKYTKQQLLHFTLYKLQYNTITTKNTTILKQKNNCTLNKTQKL